MNSRPPVPQTGALTGLRYAPSDRKKACIYTLGPVKQAGLDAKRLFPCRVEDLAADLDLIE